MSMKAIMYHYVRPFSLEFPYFKHLHFEDFQKQLDYFSGKEGYVSKEDFLESLQTGVPKRGVILTFDDGFKDHYQYVLPCLKERGLWGIFYVPTRPLVSDEILNVHKIHLLLGSLGGKSIFKTLQRLIDDSMMTHKDVVDFKTKTYTNQNNDFYTELVKRILNYFIGCEQQGSVIDQLMDEFFGGRQSAGDFYLSRNEIKEMHEAGMVIGSHTVSHPVMSKLDARAQEREIRESFGLLEEITGGLGVRTFCYPYGGFHSFNAHTEKILAKYRCGFAFNVERRDIEESDLLDRPTALPRYDCNKFPFGQCRPSPPSGTRGMPVRLATPRRRDHAVKSAKGRGE